jgi:hypothetical protein
MLSFTEFFTAVLSFNYFMTMQQMLKLYTIEWNSTKTGIKIRFSMNHDSNSVFHALELRGHFVKHCSPTIEKKNWVKLLLSIITNTTPSRHMGKWTYSSRCEVSTSKSGHFIPLEKDPCSTQGRGG